MAVNVRIVVVWERFGKCPAFRGNILPPFSLLNTSAVFLKFKMKVKVISIQRIVTARFMCHDKR
jgi:hypothetical protein